MSGPRRRLRVLAVDDEPPALDELGYLLDADPRVESVLCAGDAASAMRLLRDVDAVFLGGNGFRVAGAVGPLEERSDRLVLESNQVLLWSVNVSLGAPLDVRGFGRLLEPRRGNHS